MQKCPPQDHPITTQDKNQPTEASHSQAQTNFNSARPSRQSATMQALAVRQSKGAELVPVSSQANEGKLWGLRGGTIWAEGAFQGFVQAEATLNLRATRENRQAQTNCSHKSHRAKFKARVGERRAEGSGTALFFLRLRALVGTRIKKRSLTARNGPGLL